MAALGEAWSSRALGRRSAQHGGDRAEAAVRFRAGARPGCCRLPTGKREAQNSGGEVGDGEMPGTVLFLKPEGGG